MTVKGTSLISRTVSGKTLEEGTYSFTSGLPRQNDLVVGVKKTEGRGSVSVIQQPNPGNDYSAVIRIYDDDGGAREYSLEIFWYRKE